MPSKGNWFGRHKVSTALGAIIVLIIIAAAVGGGGDNNNGATDGDGGGQATQTEGAARLFSGRPDSQPEDQERNVGEAATIEGVEATLTQPMFQQQLSDFETGGYIVVDVALRNTGDGTQNYSAFHWKLQTPSGRVVDAYLGGQQLGTEDLVAGGSTAGQVIWEVGAEKGDFYVIWKPEAFDAARGVWKVTI